MVKYAAYYALSIYATGDSPEQAVATARDAAKDPTAQFETAPINDALAAWIDEYGWNGNRRSFNIDVATGSLIDTTDK